MAAPSYSGPSPSTSGANNPRYATQLLGFSFEALCIITRAAYRCVMFMSHRVYATVVRIL